MKWGALGILRPSGDTDESGDIRGFSGLAAAPMNQGTLGILRPSGDTDESGDAGTSRTFGSTDESGDNQ